MRDEHRIASNHSSDMDTSETPIPPKDAEELYLEKLVFGDEAGFEANLRRIENLYDYSDEEDFDNGPSAEHENESDEAETGDAFYIDEAGDENIENFTSADAMDVDSKQQQNDSEEAAWHDSDDDKATVALDLVRSKGLRVATTETALSGASYVARLRSQYEKIYPRPEWAVARGKSEEPVRDTFAEAEEEDLLVGTNTDGLAAILKSTTTFTKSTTAHLPPGRLAILRLKDANIARRARSGIHALAFHPLHPLLLTGGFDRTLRIYHIDGKVNRFVSLVHFRNMPVTSCLFVSGEESTSVYASGRRKYMHRWDISSGEVEKILRMYGQDKFQPMYDYFKLSPMGTAIALRGSSGWVNSVSATTGQFVKGYKVDGYVVDFAYAHDESTLIVANHSGTIWEFDLSSSSTKVTRKWADTSAVAVTRIALGGPGDRWLAVGTKSGMVNLFDRLSCNGSDSPKPFKEISNIVTEITDLKFSPDGQILCMSSLQKKDALKLVHLPLGTVFSNWPTSGTPLGRVTVLQFSPDNQILAIGNDVGRITLWRLDHY